MCHHRVWLGIVLMGGCLALPGTAADEPKKPKIDFPKQVKLLIDLTNEARAKEKLPPLKVHDLLTTAAIDYSVILSKDRKNSLELMFKKDPKVHMIGGKDPGQRLDDLKYEWIDAGENVGCALRFDEFKAIFDRWMLSKIHRDNILKKSFEEIGVGIYKHPDHNEWYITQLFGARKKAD
jgi:uncharacterized protein YkwD